MTLPTGAPHPARQPAAGARVPAAVAAALLGIAFTVLSWKWAVLYVVLEGGIPIVHEAGLLVLATGVTLCGARAATAGQVTGRVMRRAAAWTTAGVILITGLAGLLMR